MINMRVSNTDKAVYIDVSGYISSNDAKKFINEYKQNVKGIKFNQYKLIVTPSIFECENIEDLRSVCMTFFKNGYKRMYLIDPENYIMGNMNLGKIEQKLFNKAVKVVPSINQIK
ncbi:hypothetical protein [Romboutsia lituseburensis]|uniref:hypothetical protein n=1 Tax=Romboutsia lituseburensis TaxID=1537 RepID=UPI00215B440C|nr:hypothetical protein [Romboutsia lituseburensis]MCR8745409.1 hypothetical protein [Romboutsia lituseburensis]